MPVLRRRRQNAVVDDKSIDFQEKAEQCVSKIKSVMEDMKTHNNNFTITSSESELVVDVGDKGKFVFTIDYEMSRINFLSPVSGVFQYTYDETTMQWLDSNDNHDIRGLVTRDLLRYWKGLPNF